MAVHKSFQVLSPSFVGFIKGKLTKKKITFHPTTCTVQPRAHSKVLSSMTGSIGYKLGLALFQFILMIFEVCPTWEKDSSLFPLCSPFGLLIDFFFFPPNIIPLCTWISWFSSKNASWMKTCTYPPPVFVRDWGTPWRSFVQCWF